uniref:U11/U12 small nuclear ribonucleoprotein 65 kDa protein isoform X1 n=1 Tax=Erigeron canadensis TaxID=72917 RepID=UPI001CB9CE73|nr:U11/U12 small nuclear ribonucleoprotein 65 kDa protein isoform X1 [Erigeron canadensis]XP_043638410.1 U11/U12 small nuclear ribonucleoprotein 65 kDa protein isoform X1 [Erigeron canadensis]XP_043638417.1 U11/U12 small nuclear ribonucleoprotein 65 kDa protein isoform X1 [Erigeron canadensis]XP_043638423.1 U11/U12 small nuclear ribonucleoprotein 65 kDa protein isoform X1 [Erigeron canadensis]XP_043638431.1 U11/U12 small nuclear ribonucleoprotein 65 kDa protein isoform X1 [Erigeron canadensis]
MANVPPFQPPTFQQPPYSQGMHDYGYHSASEAPARPPEKEVATLLIRRLPEAIPHDTLSRLFSHYGASFVRPCTTGRMRNCAFVDFNNESLAIQAQRQLNGLRFLGKVLSVERASTQPHDTKSQQNKPTSRSVAMSSKDDSSLAKDLKRDPLPALEPIAEKLGVDYPFPPNLEYAYPPPDGNILTNILNALIAVPRFYTQVLHLMNKLNIPAPFRAALPTPPLPPSAPAPHPPPPPPVDTNSSLVNLSSGESELESSDEEDVGARGTTGPRRKRIKREAIVGPAVNKDIAHEAVGLKPATLVPKEIPMIKKKNPVLQIKIAPKQTQTSEQVDNNVVEEIEEVENNSLNTKPFATVEELEHGKLPPEEILSLPMFKNYKAGNPAPVLYIKNLAKDVVTDDFYFVFGTFFGNIETAKESLSVKLMQEGRMRGQAFVTFPTIDIAHRALNLVNGFVFKGKPMIIQFGRNTSAGKTTEK